MFRRCSSVPLASVRPRSSSCSCRYPPLFAQTRHQASRDKQRNQSGADGNSGQQMGMCESPDFTEHIKFGANALEHINVPELPLESRNQSELEKDRTMRKRFGDRGPGEELHKNLATQRRDMLQAQQDIDGLPWEVRWKKSLVPTPEEIVSEIRDRFDLYILDPIEREMEWYLHWKDRGFKASKDRLIWPQGFTDYLDHYDEHGRRRVLPSDQRWSDTSWKHLSDTNYRSRMWLVEGENRKSAHLQLRDRDTLIAEEEQRQLEDHNVYHSLLNGIVDLNPDQAYEALSNTANPLEVAKTKMKIASYGAKQLVETGKPKKLEDIDPVTGLPKSDDMELLPCGLSVEQGAHVAARASIQLEMIETASQISHIKGKDGLVAHLKAHHHLSKEYGDTPGITTKAIASIEDIKEESRQLGLTPGQRSAQQLSNAFLSVEKGAQITDGKTPPPSTPAKTGFINTAAQPPPGADVVPPEMMYTPKKGDPVLDVTPEWYTRAAIDTDPLITSYGLTQDPLELAAVSKPKYYSPPVMTDDMNITNDDCVKDGHSAFDEARMHKQRAMPELSKGFRPLPLFTEVHTELTEEVAGTAEAGEQKPASDKTAGSAKKKKKLKRSGDLIKAREESRTRQQDAYDPDVMLPSLPWETSGVHDPYRGVSKVDIVPYDKPALERTWKAYRETFQQMITEFNNVSSTVTEDKSEKLLLDTMKRFRNGDVGEHPPIDPEQEMIFGLIFEAHTRQFMSDLYKVRGGKSTEAQVAKQESDDMLKRASAKSKLQGPSFMDFIQEMTALELDSVRKNPVQQYAVLIKDKKFEPLAKPFLRWIEKDLAEYNQIAFQTQEHLENQYQCLLKTVNDAKNRCPSRVEGIQDGQRDFCVIALHCWCRATLSFYTAKKNMQFYLDFAETRFRSRAESLFEDSIELYQEYYKAGRQLVSIPVPDCDPPYQYEESEFLDGESGYIAEVQGMLDKAEGIWHSGTTKRWYPVLDETEYMWYNERRGRMSLAIDISTRCLESLNKKTHPSVHPFPERAYVFLEGAPLTQETAEHLWLRHMGDIYFEHALMMARLGQFASSRELLDRSVNVYHLAIRTAKERLPTSWKAPLLTTAKYLMRSYDPAVIPTADHVHAVNQTCDALYAMSPQPAHWTDPFENLPIRVSLLLCNIPAYGQLITEEALKITGKAVSNEALMAFMALRSKGFQSAPELDAHFAAVNTCADNLFRKRILHWRSKEVEGCDAFYMMTYMYFTFRIHMKSPEMVQQHWDLYEPTHLYIYTQASLANKPRGYNLLNDSIRRMCQILLPGDAKHRDILLGELVKTREKLAHLIDRRELDRTINTLEAHIASPGSIDPYCYGAAILHRQAITAQRIRENPLTRMTRALPDYGEIQKRQQGARDGNMTSANSQEMMQNTTASGDSNNMGIEPTAVNTRTMFADKQN